MLEIKELLKAKLLRIVQGDEATIAFVNILFTCGGEVQDSIFASYRASWGGERFNDVKKHLIEEGVILEKDESLILNYPAFEALSHAEKDKLVKEFSQFLFEKGWPFYRKVLKEALSTKEGEYILSEFAKAGPFLDESNMEHVSRVAGWRYYSEVRELIEKTGLFVRYLSNKKHYQYRLFLPLITLFRETPEQEEALAFIYIAKHEDEVLQSDIPKHVDQMLIESLEILNLIEKRIWNKFTLFKTTPEGDLRAKPLIQQRLERVRPALEKALQDIPPRALLWLWNTVLEDRSSDARITSYYYHHEYGELKLFGEKKGDMDKKPKCLLNVEKLDNLRIDFLKLLEERGLAVRVHRHVSTRGGETRDEVYVIAPEVLEFIRNYLTCHNIVTDEPGPLFPEELQVKHKFWHALYLWGVVNSWKDTRLDEARKYDLNETEFKKVMDSLVNQGLVKETEKTWELVDKYRFQQFIREKFLVPLVEYLFARDRSDGGHTPLVKGGRGLREGRGFSKKELFKAGVKIRDIKYLNIPYDPRRKTIHPWNVIRLKSLMQQRALHRATSNI